MLTNNMFFDTKIDLNRVLSIREADTPDKTIARVSFSDGAIRDQLLPAPYEAVKQALEELGYIVSPGEIVSPRRRR